MKKNKLMSVEYEEETPTLPLPNIPEPNDENDLTYFDNMDAGSLAPSTDIPLERHQDLLKSLTNFSPYLRETIFEWLGMTYNQELGKYTPDPLLKPTMNIQGAIWCAGFMKTYARENNIITDISKQEYTYMVLDIIETVWLVLTSKKEEFGIPSNADLLGLANKLEHTAELVLMGAGDGRYNKMLGTTYHHNSSHTDMPRQNHELESQQVRKQTMIGRMKKVLLG